MSPTCEQEYCTFKTKAGAIGLFFLCLSMSTCTAGIVDETGVDTVGGMHQLAFMCANSSNGDPLAIELRAKLPCFLSYSLAEEQRLVEFGFTQDQQSATCDLEVVNRTPQRLFVDRAIIQGTSVHQVQVSGLDDSQEIAAAPTGGSSSQKFSLWVDSAASSKLNGTLSFAVHSAICGRKEFNVGLRLDPESFAETVPIEALIDDAYGSDANRIALYSQVQLNAQEPQRAYSGTVYVIDTRWTIEEQPQDSQAYLESPTELSTRILFQRGEQSVAGVDAAGLWRLSVQMRVFDLGTFQISTRSGMFRFRVVGPTFYSDERVLSPLTEEVVRRLRDIAVDRSKIDGALIRVGDSQTSKMANGNPSAYLECFSSDHVDLGCSDAQYEKDRCGHVEIARDSAFVTTSLISDTVDFFKAHQVFDDSINGLTTVFSRKSKAAKSGMSAWWPVTPQEDGLTPLEKEMVDVLPRFAFVMFGSNDCGGVDYEQYGSSMLKIADQLTGQGTIPIFSTFPPRDDNSCINSRVPLFNALVRAAAQLRQIPLIDLWKKLNPLTDHGLWDFDRVHLNSWMYPCWMGPDYLSYGQNLRNLLSIEMLARLKETVLDQRDIVDEPVERKDVLLGNGSEESPFQIPALPFGDGFAMAGQALRYQWAAQSSETAVAVLIDVNQAGLQLCWRDADAATDTCSDEGNMLRLFPHPGKRYTIEIRSCKDTGPADFLLAIARDTNGCL